MRGPQRSPEDDAVLAGGLVGFANLLRTAGIEVGTGDLQTAASALSCIDPDDRIELYWALRCSLLSTLGDVEAFDAAFAAFFGDQASLPTGLDRPRQPPAARGGGPDAGGAVAEGSKRSVAPADDGGAASQSGAGWSPRERLREMDFSAYGPEELARARRLIERLGRTLPTRRSRRACPSHRGRIIDPRQTLRGSLRTGGYPMELYWRRRKHVPRKLVFVVDVSGSMEPYSRPIVIFLHAARRSSRKVEAFAFGTRLTRLTPALETGDSARSLAHVAEAVPDWAGGTRIGESLRALRERLGGGALVAGAVVVIVSDGWERGDLELLRAEMERLHRAAYALVWVNPLAGDPRYEPLAAGMSVAREYVDVFLPGHNLLSLEALAEALERLSGIPPRSEKPAAWRAEPAFA